MIHPLTPTARSYYAENADARARYAFFLALEGLSPREIAEHLSIAIAEVPALVATGEHLVPKRRRRA